MKLKKRLCLFLLVGILGATSLMGCSKTGDKIPEEGVTGEEKDSKEEAELLILAAASLTDVLEELKDLYKAIEPETKLTFTFASSGALQAQIEEGAPADIFMSAAEKQMDALEEKGNIINDTRKTLLLNKVVLIRPVDSSLDLSSFEYIGKDEVKRIAIGDPASVPVGQYSEEIFSNLNIGDKIDEKLVLATDVRTVLNWVEMGEVDCGIVYATDAMISDKVNIAAEAPEGSHKEVTYPVAVVKDSKNEDRSRGFLDFLSTDEAKEIFEKYGFSMK